jgi:hypothetical protein
MELYQNGSIKTIENAVARRGIRLVGRGGRK